jgi:fibronectin type 3 domain-containing protein
MKHFNKKAISIFLALTISFSLISPSLFNININFYGNSSASTAPADELPELLSFSDDTFKITSIEQTDTSITLQWTEIDSAGSVTYDLIINQEIFASDISDTRFTAMGLSPMSEYVIQIIAKSNGIFYIESETITVYTDMVITAATALFEDMTVGNLRITGGSLNLNEYTLNVTGDVIISSGTLVIGGGGLVVDGNLRLQTRNANGTFTSGWGSLNMTNANDYVLVNGNFVTQTGNSHSGLLTNGILEVKGNFTQITSSDANNFFGTANHRVILSGDSLQTVTFASISSRFATLELQNFSDAGVRFAIAINATTLIQNGSRITFNDGSVLGWTLTQNTVHDGNLLLSGETLDLNGFTLTVNGNLIQSGGTVRISGGELVITGDYLIQTPAGGASTGRLIMTNTNDLVKVGGNFATRSTTSHSGLLTAGVMEIGGNFNQFNNSNTNFQASGTHKVIFNGNGLQTVNFANPSATNSRFSGLEIMNTSRAAAEGVRFSSNAFVTRELFPTDSIVHNSFNLHLASTAILTNNTWKHDLRFADNYTLTNDTTIGGSLYINGGTFNLNGMELNIGRDVILGGGTLNMNGGRIFVGRNFRAQTESIAADLTRTYSSGSGNLRMNNENDYIRVSVNFITQSTASHSGQLTNGVLEVRGSFTQITSSSDLNFLATNNHRVVLNGTRHQTVSFGSVNSRFNTLEINKHIEIGYTFNRTPLWNTLVENIDGGQAPAAPQNLRASNIAISSIQLEWAANDDNITAGYDVFRNGERIGSTIGNTFIDSGLRSNTMYAYYVIAYDITRNMSDWSNILEVRTNVNDNAPTAPGSFTAVRDGETTIRLSWTVSSAIVPIEGYNIYRDGVLIGTSSGTAYTDNTAFPGLYTYYVRALDIDGNESAPSVSRTIDNMPPTTPVLILERYQNTSVLLSFFAEDNVAVTAYHVYQNNTRVLITSDNYFASHSLLLDTDYEFYVVAFDAAGNASERSNVLTLTTIPDTIPPVITRITPNSSLRANVIPLTVTATDNMGVASILLQYSRDEITWIDITTFNADGRTSITFSYNFDISDFSDGLIYVRAIARDTSDNLSSLTNTPIIEYLIDHTPPAPPSNLRTNHSITNGRIELIWNAPPDNDVSHFRIYKATGADAGHILIRNNHRALNFFDADMDIGVDYYYYVIAVDMVGNESAKSNTIHVIITDDDVPPKILSMSPANGSKINGQQRISILCFDNIRLAGITVEVSLEGSDEWEIVHTRTLNSHNQIVDFTLDTTGFITGNYLVRARVIDWNGNESDYFTSTYSFRELTLPQPRVTATPGGWQINLSWQATDDDSLAGYRIHKRSADNNNFTVIANTTSTTFTDRQVVAGRTFFYFVEAVDTYGNTIRSTIISAVPTHEDNIPPIANAGVDMLVISGQSVRFDSSRSWDNHFIASYLWCFGNGSTSTLPNPTHTFTEGRPHTVTLTVTDSAGNTDTATITVVVLEANDFRFLEFQVIDKNTRAPLRDAIVFYEIEDSDIDTFMTDSNGIARVPVKNETVDFYFYRSGYMPLRQTIDISDSTPRQIIELESGAVVTGEITVERLTLNEIINLGIDVTAPENQHVFQFEMEVSRNSNTGAVNVVVNSRGEIIQTNVNVTYISDDRSTLVLRNENPPHPGNFSNIGSNNSNTINPHSVTYIQTIPNRDPSQPATIVLLNVSADISWLKEFFSVSLDIINNASEDFPIIDAFADIRLPNGLSLPQTNGDNRIRQDMGNVAGGTSASASWIIRGDVKGEYDIEADFTGILMPFGEELNVRFKTLNPIKVWGGDALRLDIGVTLHEGDTSYTTFTLTNISDINIYNLSMNLEVFSEIFDINDLVFIYPNGVVEIIPWRGGSPSLAEIRAFSPALRRANLGMSVLYPGESISGYFTFGRDNTNPGDDDPPNTDSTNIRKIQKHSDEIFNVVYVIDTRDIICYNEFEDIKNELFKATMHIFEYSRNARIYFMEQNTNPAGRADFYTSDSGKPYFENIWEIVELLNEGITLRNGSEVSNISYISDAITYINNSIDKSVPTFVFTMFDQDDVYYRQADAYTALDELSDNGISVGVIAEIDSGYTQGYVFDLLESTESVHLSRVSYAGMLNFVYLSGSPGGNTGDGNTNAGVGGGGGNISSVGSGLTQAVVDGVLAAIGQNALSTADALTVLRAVAGLTTLSAEQREKYDLNGDGKIDTADAMWILRSIAGLENTSIFLNPKWCSMHKQRGCIHCIDHKVDSTGQTLSGSCEKAGGKIYVCRTEGCGIQFFEKAPLGHNLGNPIITPATCTSPQLEGRVCQRAGCSHIVERITSPPRHDYKNEQIPATCITHGILRVSCVGCSFVMWEEQNQPPNPMTHKYNSFGVCSFVIVREGDDFDLTCGHIENSPPTMFQYFMFRGGERTFANVITREGYYEAARSDNKKHVGIDIVAAKSGTIRGMPVYSVGDGTVHLAGVWGGYGQCVVIQTDEHRIYYAHFLEDSLRVIEEQSVTPKNHLGDAGNTGDVDGDATDGSHLHFEVRNAIGTSWFDPTGFYPDGVFTNE